VRVLFFIDTLASGGAQRQAVELAVRLVESGRIQARFAAYRTEDFFRPRLEAAGIEVTLVPKALRYDPLFPRRLRADLSARPVDVVHAFLLPPSLWARLAVRGLPAELRPALIAAERNERIATSPIEAVLQRFIYRGADLITVNAASVAVEVERRCGIPAHRIRYVPNGIDLDSWDKAMLQPCPLELEPGCFHVAMVGRIAPEKNHELLLDALARLDPALLRGWRVWLIGAGSTDSAAGRRLQARARRAGLSQVLRFSPPQRGIASVMARLSLLVLSSHFEGFPNVVLEAMASRLPVVATRVGDVPNMIEDRVSGFIVPPGDAAALAAAMLRAYRLSEAERTALGAAARSRVDRCFRMDAIAQRYLELYSELAGARGQGA
jgi:glycosyltransferase involved in cell wall biosynthesis